VAEWKRNGLDDLRERPRRREKALAVESRKKGEGRKVILWKDAEGIGVLSSQSLKGGDQAGEGPLAHFLKGDLLVSDAAGWVQTMTGGEKKRALWKTGVILTKGVEQGDQVSSSIRGVKRGIFPSQSLRRSRKKVS